MVDALGSMFLFCEFFPSGELPMGLSTCLLNPRISNIQFAKFWIIGCKVCQTLDCAIKGHHVKVKSHLVECNFHSFSISLMLIGNHWTSFPSPPPFHLFNICSHLSLLLYFMNWNRCLSSTLHPSILHPFSFYYWGSIVFFNTC